MARLTMSDLLCDSCMHANAGKIGLGRRRGTMIGESVKLNLVAYTCTCSLIGVLPALVVGAVRARVQMRKVVG